MSEDAAHRRVNAARFMRQFPELFEMLARPRSETLAEPTRVPNLRVEEWNQPRASTAAGVFVPATDGVVERSAATD